VCVVDRAREAMRGRRHIRRALGDVGGGEIEPPLQVVRVEHDDDQIERIVRLDARAKVSQTVAIELEGVAPPR
jgi:hypothetical protein